MDIVGTAHAQIVARESASAMNEWVFILAGLVLGVLAIFMIFKQFNVSSGHAIVLGVAVGVACLPYVANFEWTKDGFKFTTKLGSELTAQLEALTRGNTEIRESLKNVSEALKTATERVAALEKAAQAGADNPDAPPPGSGDGKFDPAFFDELIMNNEAAIRLNEQRLNELGDLRQQFQRAQ